MYDPNWRQKALDSGDDQNSPMFAQQRALEAQNTAGGGSGAGTSALPMFNQPTIDLQKSYETLFAGSGIGDIESTISTKEKARNDALAKINDNPYFSEATRVGRVAKLDQIFQNDTASLRNDVATRKADLETRFGLQTKQFDINSQQAQQAFTQFSSLLSMGALDNASGVDIANLTRATGLSSSQISSAIQATKDAKKKDVPTQIIQTDDGTNTGYAVINTQTGEIIKKETVGGSKPEKTKATGTGSTKETKTSETADVKYLIQLYKNANKKNPSWKKGSDLRKQYSPKDFLSNLLLQYPSASAYIKANFKV